MRPQSKLIGTCDVMLENFRPGLMTKLGLDYDTLSKIYPGLIYVSHKGFLPGPYEKRLALDEVVQMMGGLSYMTGPVGRPLRAGTSVNDIMGGMFGAIGVLAALRERESTGRGQEVQSALFENCVFLSAQHMQQYAMTREPPPPMPARYRHGASTTSSRWPTASSFSSARSATSSSSRCATCWNIRILPPSPTSPPTPCVSRYAPGFWNAWANSSRTIASKNSRRNSKRPAFPYAPIVRPEQLLDDPHLKASGGLVPMETEDGSMTEVVLLPLTMGGRRPGVRQALARVGEHTQEILSRLTKRVSA